MSNKKSDLENLQGRIDQIETNLKIHFDILNRMLCLFEKHVNDHKDHRLTLENKNPYIEHTDHGQTRADVLQLLVSRDMRQGRGQTVSANAKSEASLRWKTFYENLSEWLGLSNDVIIEGITESLDKNGKIYDKMVTILILEHVLLKGFIKQFDVLYEEDSKTGIDQYKTRLKRMQSFYKKIDILKVGDDAFKLNCKIRYMADLISTG